MRYAALALAFFASVALAQFEGRFAVELPERVGQSAALVRWSLECGKDLCKLAMGQSAQVYDKLEPASPGDLSQARNALRYAQQRREQGRQQAAWLAPLLDSSADIQSCIDLGHRKPAFAGADPPGMTLLCSLDRNPWQRPVVLLMGTLLAGCGPAFCRYEMTPMFADAGPKAEAPDVKVGDEWQFAVYYTVPATQPNRHWVVTAVTPDRIEATENGQPLRLTRELNVLDSPVSAYTDRRALQFPLEVGRRWRYSTGWLFKPKGSRGTAEGEVAVVAYEKVKVPAGEFDAFRLSAKEALGGNSPSGTFYGGEATLTYWYAPAARAIVKSLYHNPYQGSATVELVAYGRAAAPGIAPFTTDGCSLFPDRSLVRRKDWCSCCVAHDLAYWRGGTAAERLKADEELRACVLKATRDAALAEVMFAGVRTGGGPYFATPYRWGYGWKFGRNYEPLSADEDKQAAALRAAYLAKNPSLACSLP